VKKRYWKYWLQVCTIRLPDVCSFRDSVQLPASRVSAHAGLSRRNTCTTCPNACLCFITADTQDLMQRQLGDRHYSKFGQLLTHSSQKLQVVYTLEEQLTTDETICQFQGCIFYHVYIKGKPHIYGIKIFEFCEAKSGYVYNLEVYSGTHPTNSEHIMAVSVVDRLCHKIKGKGHCVYMERWFASPKIFDHLWGWKTKAVGTVMSNRKKDLTSIFWKSEKKKKKKKG